MFHTRTVLSQAVVTAWRLVEADDSDPRYRPVVATEDADARLRLLLWIRHRSVMAASEHEGVHRRARRLRRPRFAVVAGVDWRDLVGVRSPEERGAVGAERHVASDHLREISVVHRRRRAG